MWDIELRVVEEVKIALIRILIFRIHVQPCFQLLTFGSWIYLFCMSISVMFKVTGIM